MKKPLVYLAGPISGLSFGVANYWRTVVTSLLAPGIGTINPLRGKERLSDMETITSGEVDGFPDCSDNAIVTRDRFDLQRADAVLFNLLLETPRYTGTLVEYGWADAWRKPIITVAQIPGPWDHPFIRHLSGWIVPVPLAAVYVLRRLFNVSN